MMLSILTAMTLVVPQPQNSAGNFAGAALSLGIDQVTQSHNPSLDQEIVYYKPAGLRDGPPILHPNVNASLSLDMRNVPWTPYNVVVDAITLGIDWISMDPTTGIAAATFGSNQGYSGVIWSVSRNTQGVSGPWGLTIRREANDDDVASDLFQFVYPDSIGVNPELIGQVVRAIDSSEIRLTGPGGPTAQLTQPNMTAVDPYAPILIGSPNSAQIIMQDFERIVFSVTEATKASIPTSWLEGLPESKKSGGLLFESRWLGDHWGPVGLFRRNDLSPVLPGQHGFAAEGEDVISVSWDRRNKLLAFTTHNSATIKVTSSDSLDSTPPHQFYHGPILASLSVTLTERIGVETGGRVDALAFFDPRIPNFQHFFGTPMRPPTVGENEGNASMFRHMNYELAEPREQHITSMTTAGLPSSFPLGQYGAEIWIRPAYVGVAEGAGAPAETQLGGVLLSSNSHSFSFNSVPLVGVVAEVQWRFLDLRSWAPGTRLPAPIGETEWVRQTF